MLAAKRLSFSDRTVQIVFHLFYWMLAFLFYLFFFGRYHHSFGTTAIYVVYLLPVTMAATYFVLYVLLPRYVFHLRTRSWKKMVLYSFYTLVVFTWLVTLIIFRFLWQQLVSADLSSRMDYTTLDLVIVVAALLLVIILAVAMRVILHWVGEQRRAQSLLQEKVQAELRMLRTQLNPHFLFNTLNSIYSLALSKSDQAPEVVLKLSDMLNYVLYECRAGRVSLTQEIRFLQNYIDLQKIRFGDKVNVEFEFPDKVNSIHLPPSLLIPFVENSFKHGAGSRKERFFIKIKLAIDEDSLVFDVKNNYNGEQHLNKAGGIGQESVSRQLRLLFGEHYSLNIQHVDGIHSVSLKFPYSTHEEKDENSVHDRG